VAYGGIAVLSALDYRLRTGKGVYIDLSQYEAGLQFLGGACSTTQPMAWWLAGMVTATLRSRRTDAIHVVMDSVRD